MIWICSISRRRSSVRPLVLEYNRVVLDARLNRIGSCLGLLHDLLEHKVLVAALFRGGDIPR